MKFVLGKMGVLLYGHVSVCFNLLVISREEKHFF